MEFEISELLPIVRSTASEVFSSVFGMDFVPEEPWSIVCPVENPCDMGATVSFKNELCQGACTLGISSEAASVLFPDLSIEMLFDALGEVANNVCGQLSSDPRFTSSYGILEQTPPLFSRGGAWLGRSVGIRGSLLVGPERILLGFTVQPPTPARPRPESLG